MAQTQYDAAFYASQADGSRRSADVVAPLVVDLVRPRSVVDVGCGVGTWLASFMAAGIEDVCGLDGDYVQPNDLRIPQAKFHTADLTERVTLGRTFDLAVSLEVAEHLPGTRSATFIEDLVRLAPVVLFSAAIPGQGGTNHVNERWQDEWAAEFALHGYVPHDLIRPAVWDDEGVEPWYRQNAVLYAKAGTDLPSGGTLPLRAVHPALFSLRIYQETRAPTIKEAVGVVRQSMRRSLGRRLRR